MKYNKKDLDGDDIIVLIQEDSTFPAIWFNISICYSKKFLFIPYLSKAYTKNKIVDECVDFTCEDFEKLGESFVIKYNEHIISNRKNKSIRKKLKECK